MNSYFLTFFFFNRHCLTFEASSPSGLLHLIEQNKDFLLELMSENETDIMFYRDPEKRFYWLIENARTLDDAIFNLVTHGHKIKPQGTRPIWTF